MLYLLRNLRTTLSFRCTEIDKVADKKQVWIKLREKIQGKCTNQYGVIVHIPDSDLGGSENNILPLARVDSTHGCSFQIQFSAISFKAQKNDLICAKITQMQSQCITCLIGPIEVKIPKTKLDPRLEYDKSLNCFRVAGKNYRLQIGNLILCKVFESRIKMGSIVQIIAELTKLLLDINIDLKQ